MKEKNAKKKVQVKKESKEKLPAKKILTNNIVGNRGATPLAR
jgi:hypothetical protein